MSSGGDEKSYVGQSLPSHRTEWTHQEKSPSPMTKLVFGKTTSPREFFEKLYGLDIKDIKDTAKDRVTDLHQPSSSMSVPGYPRDILFTQNIFYGLRWKNGL